MILRQTIFNDKSVCFAEKQGDLVNGTQLIQLFNTLLSTAWISTPDFREWTEVIDSQEFFFWLVDTNGGGEADLERRHIY